MLSYPLPLSRTHVAPGHLRALARDCSLDAGMCCWPRRWGAELADAGSQRVAWQAKPTYSHHPPTRTHTSARLQPDPRSIHPHTLTPPPPSSGLGGRASETAQSLPASMANHQLRCRVSTQTKAHACRRLSSDAHRMPRLTGLSACLTLLTVPSRFPSHRGGGHPLHVSLLRRESFSDSHHSR